MTTTCAHTWVSQTVDAWLCTKCGSSSTPLGDTQHLPAPHARVYTDALQTPRVIVDSMHGFLLCFAGVGLASLAVGLAVAVNQTMLRA